jgi:hypothetical protein
MTQPEVPTSRGPEAVRIKLLGGFSVSMGSRTIRPEEWRSKKAVTLVKFLTLTGTGGSGKTRLSLEITVESVA